MALGKSNSEPFALVNCDVFTGDGVEFDHALIIRGKRIEKLVPFNDLPAGIAQCDLKGQSVAAGFIDVQVNGGGDVLFNDCPTTEGVKTIVEAHRKFGTTSILPTFITGSNEGMRNAAETIRSAIEAGTKGILGVHFEGPFIAESKAGVHDKKYIRVPNENDLSILESLIGVKTLFTVAPEIVTPELIQRLCKNGVLISLGHTDANCDLAKEAFEAGASCTTHLYNAMSALTSRSPGVLGAALDDRNSWAGIIMDGFHVDFVSARVAIRAKAKGKTFLVTDAMSPVGGERNHFKLGPYDIRVDQGRCVTNDGVLAGSALDMATAVRNCVQKLGMPKDEALRMASTYVAEFLGLEKELGRVKPGYRANLTIFNNQINVSAVVIDGELIELS